MAEVSGTSSRQRWTLVLVCTATFMLLLDITVVSAALRRQHQATVIHRASSATVPATGSSGSVSASGRHSPRTVTIPAAVARAIASPANRVFPTPHGCALAVRASHPGRPVRAGHAA